MSLNHLQRILILVFVSSVLISQTPVRPYSDTSAPDWIEWIVRRISYFSGLDNTWEMFSYAHRDYYRLVFLGEKPSEKNILLTLPNQQSDRSLLTKLFFDFREEKFLLNIYGKNHALDAYISYLCRNAPEAPLSKITIQVDRFQIVSLSEARKTGRAFEKLDPYIMREKSCSN